MSSLLKCFPHSAPRSALVLGFPCFPALWIQMGPKALLGSLLLSHVTCCLLLLPDLLELPVISGLPTPQLFISCSNYSLELPTDLFKCQINISTLIEDRHLFHRPADSLPLSHLRNQRIGTSDLGWWKMSSQFCPAQIFFSHSLPYFRKWQLWFSSCSVGNFRVIVNSLNYNSHSIHKQILLAPPSKYTQKFSASHYLHPYHTGSSHQHHVWRARSSLPVCFPFPPVSVFACLQSVLT